MSAPARRPVLSRRQLVLAIALGCGICICSASAEDAAAEPQSLDTVHVTAAQIARQALGSSVITAEDIERRPPVNDLSQLLRTMPGVNLTGNSASGQYGNNRQIDLRGMGPENTLILVDGKPVGSRDAVRMGRSGERNTRGDTNWVPAEAVERIEVLRGPAAARYGSGASGGVVNIITKKPTGDLTGSMSLFGLVPQHSAEGGGQRAGFQLSGPLSDTFSFRLYGNLNKTDPDSLELNRRFASSAAAVPPAGREGVRNKDINGLLRWDPMDGQVIELDAGFSRQGNLYAGDRAVSADGLAGADLGALFGSETNTMIRRTASLTHRGTWALGSSRLTAAYEGTDNTRLNEGLAGGPEGSIAADLLDSTATLDNLNIDGEFNLPLQAAWAEQVLTLGFERRQGRLGDAYSMSQTVSAGGGFPGLANGTRRPRSEATLSAVYLEDNIYASERLTLTPGVRLDHHSQFGNNLSPSLNVQYTLSEGWLLKGGIARAFKAPNLYQSNTNYLYYTRGNGCPVLFPNLGSGCYIQGNGNLDPEISINKEIGIEWAPQTGHHASLTYFHNAYDDKIVAGMTPVGITVDRRGQVFQWTNASEAIVQGVEGNFTLPLLGEQGRELKWNTNVTYMIENKNTATDQPLSVIPEYTVNTTLDWQPTQALSLLLTGTFYGKQESATQSSTSGGAIAPDTRDPYDLWGVSARYRITRKVSVGVGVDNLFDTRLFREGTNNTGGAAGAATYNEPGRAYWASLSFGF
ncbi:TonB-dependent siderophore receptor [Xanthomonas arboricola]|uniref:TonB-dependent siderophore receptor n=1 Tax=Xanthomonas arboricola pv. guizotiae TaxID=487867 RepID=A0A2S7A698_9XANT|nr:TonB-dependent siderophore receptor [Xanthomonas arboricola]PPU03187.1 TonB-dependent siderophore receptor [Xanthomonas arboricola pv. guizotiae]PPU25572.1 TonB-dependent siderophore receptor [Xanthomonas arboricola pv. guizotiae]